MAGSGIFAAGRIRGERHLSAWKSAFLPVDPEEAPGMNSRQPGIGKSRRVEDVKRLQLLTLLDEMVRDKGVMRAAGELNVDRRTLNVALQNGHLSRRMRGALEKALLEGGGAPAAQQRARNGELAVRVEVLEKGLEALSQETGQGLAAVRDEVRVLKKHYARDLHRVESRLARVEAGGGDGQEEEGGGESGAGGQPPVRPRQRREFPELATLDPADDDQDVFGAAWELIQEWRELKESHHNRGKGLDWLREEERLLAVELALLEEHGLTLPPETYPLRGLDRGAQVNWRREALADTQEARKRREMLRRVLTLGIRQN